MLGWRKEPVSLELVTGGVVGVWEARQHDRPALEQGASSLQEELPLQFSNILYAFSDSFK